MAFAAATFWTTKLASGMLSAVATVNLAGMAPGVKVACLHSVVKTAAALAGGVVAVGSVPVVLSAVGFTGAGIAASSLAAKMMSAAAIANGGGVASGSLVATLQSVGAAGLSVTTKAILASTGCTLGAWLVP